MNHRGLDQRLKQRGRRSGAIVGVSIMAAMALGIATFAFIYALIDPFTTDFVSNGGSGSELPAPRIQPTTLTLDLANPQNDAGDVVAEATTPPNIALSPTVEATSEANAFTPDYRVTASRRINLRSGPGTNTGVVVVLQPGTQLEFLDEQRVTDNPQRDRLSRDGRWLKFRTEQGDEGWIRDIDVDPISR